jgi:hypothetical protein
MCVRVTAKAGKRTELGGADNDNEYEPQAEAVSWVSSQNWRDSAGGIMFYSKIPPLIGGGWEFEVCLTGSFVIEQ